MGGAPLLEGTVEGLGDRGDGIVETAEGPVYVPMTAPGDRVRVRLGKRGRGGMRGRLEAVLEPGPGRRRPPCPHFGTCGGCAVQHLDDATYAAWKRARVVNSLARRGLSDVAVAPLARTPAGSRRLAQFGARRLASKITLGFNERASARIVDVETCPVLAPPLTALIGPLRGLLDALLAPGDSADVRVTLTETGIDALIESATRPTLEHREAMAAFAEAQALARIAWRERGTRRTEPVAERSAPTVRFGEVRVALPPGAFLQASPEGEAVLAREVCTAASTAKHVADLYAGLGTFALRLASGASVHAVEGDEDMAAALRKAVSGARGLEPVSVTRRDLYRRPLTPVELADFDAAVVDPPRAGAGPQVEALAQSSVPVVIAVSCEPRTFARDARTLVDGGYRIERVLPVDQFPWSHHVELVAVFRR